MSQPFEYKFWRTGYGGQGAQHCTYCPKPAGEACPLNCNGEYEKLQAERKTEGVIVNDEP